MKFSGKIEDGTSNEPLNFGNYLWPWRRSALSECFSSWKCYQWRIKGRTSWALGSEAFMGPLH